MWKKFEQKKTWNKWNKCKKNSKCNIQRNWVVRCNYVFILRTLWNIMRIVSFDVNKADEIISLVSFYSTQFWNEFDFIAYSVFCTYVYPLSRSVPLLLPWRESCGLNNELLVTASGWSSFGELLTWSKLVVNIFLAMSKQENPQTVNKNVTVMLSWDNLKSRLPRKTTEIE